MGPKEAAYDSEISQLVAQIEKLCEQHKISFVASFGLDGDLCCSCGCATADREPNIHVATLHEILLNMVENGVPTLPSVMINVRDADGNVTSSTSIMGG